MVIKVVTRQIEELSRKHRPSRAPPNGYNGPDEPDLDMGLVWFTMIFMFLSYLLSILVYFTIKVLVRRVFSTRISLHEEGGLNGGQAELSIDRHLDNEDEVKEFLQNLSAEEQFYYKQGEEYVRQNPPLIIPYVPATLENSDEVAPDPIINEQTLQFIEEEGAAAWEFRADSNLPNDTVLIQERTELTFLNFNYDASVMTTLPIPRINKVYYYECKIFELNQGKTQTDEDEMISIGLSTSPYPYFRLPGRHHHSVAYDSDGCRRMNSSFPMSPELQSLFPRFEKGDIIGIGYRSRSGTVFFTHNGKKLNEKKVGGHIKGWKLKYLYPIIGSNIPCKLHVNFGSYGFVYIEANVKKWGYSKNAGIKLPPPSYEDYDQDMLLESAYEDDGSDSESIASTSTNELTTDLSGDILPPPPGFEFSTSVPDDMVGESITMHSLPAEPPTYSADEAEAGPDDTQEVTEDDEESDEHIVNDNTIANQFVTNG